jgi:hypothetical protein
LTGDMGDTKEGGYALERSVIDGRMNAICEPGGKRPGGMGKIMNYERQRGGGMAGGLMEVGGAEGVEDAGGWGEGDALAG